MESGRGGSGRGRGAGGGPGAGGKEQSTDLFVLNLPYVAMEAELATHLEAVAGSGGVDSVALLHQSDGRPRGMAKVRMKSAALASACIAQLDGARFGGRELKVRLDGAPSAHHLSRS